MAEKKGSVIIIKKKKGGGHAGAHGGAWKVAYADFVTAMMCFFLVMWLMGADEETKAIVSAYFNNPGTPWEKDVYNAELMPQGNRRGAGDSQLQGSSGKLPVDMVKIPAIPFRRSLDHDIPQDQAGDYLEGVISAIDMSVESLKVMIPERNLFSGNSDQLSPESQKYRDKLKLIISRFKGKVMIEFTASPKGSHYVDEVTDDFELANARAVTLRNALVAEKVIDESRLSTRVIEAQKRTPANEGANEGRKVEVSLYRELELE